MKKVYISGQITGLDPDIAQMWFDKAELLLVQLGHKVVNPMNLPHDHAGTWADYMKDDIEALRGCDAIMILPNWTESRGAKIEFQIAKFYGMEIYYF